jgi:integrase
VRGHIVKRYKNSYTIVLNLGIDPATGKRKQQWVSVKGTKREAEQRLAELLHQIDTGTFMRPEKTPLSDFLKRWLKEYALPNLAPRTGEVYEYIIHVHLIPALGHVLMTQLKPEHIQKYCTDKLKNGRFDGKGGLSPKTVRNQYMTLHSALETAVRWGLLSRNPADVVAPPLPQKKEMRVWDEEETRLFLEGTRDSVYYPIFYLFLFTGLRRSELLALRWQDVDFIYCQLYISRSMHQLKTGEIVFRQPKSAKGNRTIALSPLTLQVLREYRQKREAESLLVDKPFHEEDLVFSHFDGKPLIPDTISRAWDTAVRQIGLKRIRLHDSRHTHASLMLKQGIHPKIVQERLGHASIQMTLDTYSHVVPGIQQMAANRLDDIFRNTPNPERAEKTG